MAIKEMLNLNEYVEENVIELCYNDTQYNAFILKKIFDDNNDLVTDIIIVPKEEDNNFVFAYRYKLENISSISMVSLNPFVVSIEFAEYIKNSLGINLDFDMVDKLDLNIIFTNKKYIENTSNTTKPQFTEDVLNLFQYDGRLEYIKNFLEENNENNDFRINLLHVIKVNHTKEQIYQVLMGIRNGLTKGKIQEFTWSRLKPDQMEQVRLGLENNLSTRQVRRYSVNLEYSADQMRLYRLELQETPKSNVVYKKRKKRFNILYGWK